MQGTTWFDDMVLRWAGFAALLMGNTCRASLTGALVVDE